MLNMKKINGVSLSFLLGGAVGGALGLLFAPKSGKQTREDISRTSNALYEDGKKITRESWNKAKDTAENVIENVNDVIDTNVDKIVRTSENLNEAVKSGINAYKVDKKSNSLPRTEQMRNTDKQPS